MKVCTTVLTETQTYKYQDAFWFTTPVFSVPLKIVSHHQRSVRLPNFSFFFFIFYFWKKNLLLGKLSCTIEEIFCYFNFERSYEVLKSRSPCTILTKI